MVRDAAGVFNEELVELIDSIRRDKEQIIDHDGLDTVLQAGWKGDSRENAEAMAQEFRQYLEANRDEIEALTIFYAQPHRRSELTYAMIREVLDRLFACLSKTNAIEAEINNQLLKADALHQSILKKPLRAS